MRCGLSNFWTRAGGGNAGAFNHDYSEVGSDTLHTLSETWESGAFFSAGNPEMGKNPHRETGGKAKST
jgi:hypothetical protein